MSLTAWDEAEPGPERLSAEERRRMDRAYERLFGPARKLEAPRFGRRTGGRDRSEWYATHSRYLECLVREQ